MKESSVYSVLVVSPAGRGADFLASVFDAPTFDPVVNALSAGEARRLLSSEQYDLIAVNSPLPDETGIDFCIDAAQGPSGVMLFREERYLRDRKLAVYERGNFRYPEAEYAAERGAERHTSVRNMRTAAQI